MHRPSRFLGVPRVVRKRFNTGGGQRFGALLRLALAEAVHDGGAAIGLGLYVESHGVQDYCAQEIVALLLRPRFQNHLVPQVRSLYRRGKLGASANLQHVDDVPLYFAGRGGGAREDRDVWELRLEQTEFAVVRTELVPPRADAVRLVQDHARQPTASVRFLQLGDEPLGLCDLLGGDVQEAHRGGNF